MKKKRKNGEGTFREVLSQRTVNGKIKKKRIGWRLIVQDGWAEDGSPKKKEYRGKTKRECLEKKQASEAALSCKKEKKGSDKPFEETFAQWLKIKEKSGLRRSSIERIRSVSKRICNYFKGMRIGDLCESDIQGFLLNLSGLGYGVSTSEKYISTLKEFVEYCENEDVLGQQIFFNDIRIPNFKDPKTVRALSEEEIKIVLYTAKKISMSNNKRRPFSLYLCIVIALETGCRIGELAALRIGDIHFRTGWIEVTKTAVFIKESGKKGYYDYDRPPKTTSSIRQIPISNTCETALKMQIEENTKNKKEDFLFQDCNGDPIPVWWIHVELNTLNKYIEEHFPGQCPRITMHMFRHTMAVSWLVENSGKDMQNSLPFLQKVLGHKRMDNTLDTYLTIAQAKSARLDERLAHGMQVYDDATCFLE